MSGSSNEESEKARPSARPSARRSARPSARSGARPAARPSAKASSEAETKATAKKATGAKAKTDEVQPTAELRPAVEAPPVVEPPVEEAAPREEPEPEAATTAPETTAPETTAPEGEASQAELYRMGETLDQLLKDADSIAADPAARRRAAEALTELAAHLRAEEESGERGAQEGLLGSAERLLSADYYFRQWGRLAMRGRAEEVDDFGLDRVYEKRLLPVFTRLYRDYFRVEVEGIENVPEEGRAMLVANHGGALPWDGIMLKMALRLEPEEAGERASREMRWLVEDFTYHMPFVGAFLTRIGAVRACPENAERLLARGELLAVFPEGVKGPAKLFKDRYKLQRFGRGGYVKLALRTGAPIIPTAVVGAEEAYPLLFRARGLAKLVGLPFVPVTPLFPLLGPLGLLPLPSRFRIVFGAPIDLRGEGDGVAAAEDTLLVREINDRVRTEVDALVQKALADRPKAY